MAIQHLKDSVNINIAFSYNWPRTTTDAACNRPFRLSAGYEMWAHLVCPFDLNQTRLPLVPLLTGLDFFLPISLLGWLPSRPREAYNSRSLASPIQVLPQLFLPFFSGTLILHSLNGNGTYCTSIYVILAIPH